MLLESGDLIPVKREAIDIPWTKRKALILNFLLRGPVNFKTYVYDTNVGDIAPLSTYFNPEHWTVHDLNHRFGLKPGSMAIRESVMRTTPAPDSDSEEVKSKSLKPRLLIYPVESPPITEAGAGGSDAASALTSTSAGCTPSSVGSASAFQALRAASAGASQKQPGTAISPPREADLDVQSSEWSSHPIGPCKRAKLMDGAQYECSDLPEAHTWPKLAGLIKLPTTPTELASTTYFHLLTQKSSPWSPFTPPLYGKTDTTGTQSGNHADCDLVVGQDELVSSLRRIAQQQFL